VLGKLGLVIVTGAEVRSAFPVTDGAMIGSVHRGSGIGLNAGDVFAGYIIDRMLGSGGMGEVYLAQHPRLPRREALKILHHDICADAAYRQCFIKEAAPTQRACCASIIRPGCRHIR
jgi:serine/threonine-protein kinase